MIPYFKAFQGGTLRFSAEEKKIVEKLVAAARIVGSLYGAQKNARYPGANFYPHDATRAEIEKAAKKNSAISSPYTFVERNGAGELVAIPYSKKFKKELTQVAKLLKEAAVLSKDKALKAYLVARAQDLLRDNFDKSNVLWLKTVSSRIGCVIGPFDRYLDKLFFKKRAYKVYIGCIDEKQTQEIEKFRKAIVASERKHLPGAKDAKISRMHVRVEETSAIAGLEADFYTVADNLPASADLHIIKKHGTISTVFLPMLEWRLENWILPIFENMFEEEVQRKYKHEDVRKAFFRITAFCEICHSLMRYEDAAKRLGEYFACFDDIYSDVLTVKFSSLLFLKGGLSEKELGAILTAEICQGIYYVNAIKERPQLDSFATGYTMFLDFLLEGGALQQRGKKFTIDAQRAFIAIDELSHVLEYYLSLADKDDAKEFLKRFHVAETSQKLAFPLKETKKQV